MARLGKHHAMDKWRGIQRDVVGARGRWLNWVTLVVDSVCPEWDWRKGKRRATGHRYEEVFA